MRGKVRGKIPVPLGLFQNFNFWNRFLGFNGKTGLLTGFSKSLSKTTFEPKVRILKQAPLYGVILAALVFSVIFIALHADHVCAPGEYCPVCVYLHTVMELLKHPEPAQVFGGLGLFGTAAGLLKISTPPLTKATSISLKVRLNI